MASVEKRSGAYRVKYRDPIGRQQSRSFARKLDADRFAREVEVEKDRGAWLDPRHAEMAGSPIRGEPGTQALFTAGR